jgi:curved DNA-binding protein CbpA
MKSAYFLLGVPGNASNEDIEIAFARVKLIYTPDRLANAEGALEKFNEVKIAYDVLRNPDSRAAHDRKLSAAQRPATALRPVIVVEEESPARKILTYSLLLVAAIFAAGYFISYQNAEAKRAQAAVELAAKAQAAKEEQAKQLEAERLDQDRVMAKARTEAAERRFTSDAQISAARAANEMRRQEQTALQMQRAATLDAQRQEAALRAEQRRIETDARMRVEADKRRIRELCYQQYRRYDC